MEDKLDDSTNLRLVFVKNDTFPSLDVENFDVLQKVHVGQKVEIAVLAFYSGDNDTENDYEDWKCRIRQLCAHACLTPTDCSLSSSATKVCLSGRTCQEAVTCHPCLSFVEGVENQCICNSKMELNGTFLDEKTFVVPGSVTLNSLPDSCGKVCLTVTAWLADKVNKPGSKILENLDLIMEPNDRILLDDKTVTKLVFSHSMEVLQAPNIQTKLLSVVGKHNLLLSVRNCSVAPVCVHDCVILPSSCHWTTRSPEEPECCHKLKTCTSSEESHRSSVATVVGDRMLEFHLKPGEKYSLMYQLKLQATTRQGKRSDLSLAVHVTWSYAPSTLENTIKVVTTYLLPKITFRKPPFIVSASCSSFLEKRKSFAVTYDISNGLQDFLSLKLYWSPERGLATAQDQESRTSVQNLMKSVICHDPYLELGTFPVGTSLSVKVAFQLLQPGLFELGSHMKINLRYALTSPLTPSQPSGMSPSLSNSDSNATISADDQLTMESENLWRDRSTSISSSHSVEQESPISNKRKTFATKSYSFGDLGPLGSSDSTEDPGKVRFKKIERSSAVPPPRPPPPRLALPALAVPLRDFNTSTNVMNPGNFLKKHCLAYVPGDHGDSIDVIAESHK